ncbi:MAG: transglutaminase domain-containing protein, partial [Anaerococcus vaginalis]|nr:transglutaminase domain-containing protein [Anaerococcus vaginalis]
NKKWRFSNDDGNLINSKGWKINRQGKHYAYGNGYLYTNKLITFGSKIMYFMGDDGRISIGKFLDSSNRWRFSNDDGNLINSKGWKINKQGKHYAYGNGYLYTNQFITFGPKVIYFMGDDGLMKTSKFNYMNIATFNPDSNGLISLSEYRANKPHIDAMTYANSILRKVGNSLWEAYKWAGTQIKYKTITTNASLGISYFANIGFNQRSGNCYTMASAFYYLARALGYDVHQVSGYHQGYNNIMEHSWCEIRMNGKTYIYDPDVLHEFRKSVYGMAYGQRGTLKYIVSRNVYMHL